MRMVLVTGAPRSGTTPVGAALALAAGAQMIYEPMGPTGDRRIPVRYAIPGQAGLPRDVFESFLEDLKELRIDLGAQRRKSYSSMNYAQRLLRSIIGSRTRITYWSARLAPAFDMLVWKDPMASFAVPAVVAHGIPTVICVRSPLAHAASFKRKGWKVDIAAIYPNYRECYGAVPEIERMLERYQPADSVLGASMLWHLVYRLSYRTARGDFGRYAAPLKIVTGDELESDELGVYRDLYDCLGLAFEGKARKRLEERVGRAVHDTAKPSKTHDWNRSVSATNSYWKETLDPKEILAVQKLNGWIYEALESLGVLAAKSKLASGLTTLSGTDA
jgi:hypothetical protein